ncbi:jg17092 [Pararge aegeria aegeria]|uniref:Jg17092 protein n=1 Tax=Pararge aegeria aegeria TaxID=348720 RepID=A0A8S4R6L0_9NEOP|nr:jg17092 [Pararge aegeria aegeria]
MKYHKAVNVFLQDINGNLNRGDDFYANRVATNERNHSAAKYEVYKDFSCQYDTSRDNVICTCKSTKKRKSGYFTTSRQVYRSSRYTSARGYTDVGVGSVKTVPRKMVRRIYAPDTEDRGVGSSDLSSVIC